MSTQNLNRIGLEKIGPKKKIWGNALSPKEFMKYVQYFPDQSPQTNRLFDINI